MLDIYVPEKEGFDDETSTYLTYGGMYLRLEHSLVSIAKWESLHEVPFLGTKMSPTQQLDYIRCMTITQNVNPLVYYALTEDNIKEIDNYINKPHTATIISSSGKRGSKEVVTAEIVYYWMITLNIPTEYQKWHFNRLMTLISVCSAKNAPTKKMSKREIAERNRALNEARKAKYKTKG